MFFNNSILKNSVLRNLTILLITFIIGFSTLILIHILFSNFIDDLDKKIKNEQARYKIGEYILKEINKLEVNFYKISMSFNEKTSQPIEDEIIDEIIDINKAIDVLEHGGEIQSYIKLNVVGIDNITDTIKFTPNKNNSYTYESITLRPKLASLEKKIYKVKEIVRLKKELLTYTSKEEIKEARFKIQLLFKEIPAFFIRMKESSSTLLYESKKNLDLLQKHVESEKAYYKRLEFIVSYITMSIVLIFGYLLTKMIVIKSKELEELTKKAEISAIEASNANKIKSQFLANMSHEIRTPLNAIIGFSEILSKSNMNSESKDKATIIVKSAKALLEIINDILDISKVESGKLEILHEDFNLKELLNQIVELYSITSNQKNIRLVFDLDGKLPLIVKGDEIRLKQVLSNLLSNAIKFTSAKEKVTFTVTLREIKDDIALVKFIVKDEGIGISLNDQKKIFEPFSQADGSISRRFGGTGLGLAISLKIVQLMGSKIELISKENLGSTFYFTLKLPIVELKPQIESTHKYTFFLDKLRNDYENTRSNVLNIIKEFANIIEDPTQIKETSKLDLIFCFTSKESINKALELNNKSNAPIVFIGDKSKLENNPLVSKLNYFNFDVPIFGSKVFNIIAKACKIEEQHGNYSNENKNVTFNAKILVAEDNTNNQLLIELLLQNLGITTKIVNNGLEAFEEFSNNDFDLILMDINMPIMDGITSMKKIKSLEKYKNIPIIALTANTIKGDKEKYINEGMDDYLSKPIENEQLIKLLSKYLKIKNTPIVKKIENKKSNSIDVEKIAQNLGISANIAEKIIEKFNNEIDLHINELEKFIEIMDSKNIKQKAHYIKNSCLNLSLDEACKLLQQMEIEVLSQTELKNRFSELKNIIISTKDLK
jgi:signal transduction histidine kinase/DNA-binding response OmpR family regulator